MGVSRRRLCGDPDALHAAMRRAKKNQLEELDKQVAFSIPPVTSGTTFTSNPVADWKSVYREEFMGMDDALRLKSGYWERMCSAFNGEVEWRLNKRKVHDRLYKMSMERSQLFNELRHDHRSFDKYFGPGAWKSYAKYPDGDPRAAPPDRSYQDDILDSMRYAAEQRFGQKPVKKTVPRKPLIKPFKRDESKPLAQQLTDEFYQWIDTARIDGRPMWWWKGKSLPRVTDDSFWDYQYN